MNRGKKPLRICVCTSSHADEEPRAPRHAAALASLGSQVQIIFVDCAPAGTPTRGIKSLANCDNVTRKTHYFAHRGGKPLHLVLGRLIQRSARLRFNATGKVSPSALSTGVLGLERVLAATHADLYLTHNIETLLPVSRVAKASGALAMFDSMEFYSDMGDSQSNMDRALIRSVEKQCLPRCALVLASSDQVADALVEQYGIERPLPLYNMPPLEPVLAPAKSDSFNLYWRNSVVGLGQRGLEEALVALTRLPDWVTLHVQGRMPKVGNAALEARIAELGIGRRVVFHQPYQPEDAVKEAARHTVGLCLERQGNRNHEFTVSNKIFDYHMAGLAVVASELPGLRAVLKRSNGGMIFQPGSVDDLVQKIGALCVDSDLLRRLSTNARAFALREGNREVEMEKFIGAFVKSCRVKIDCNLSLPTASQTAAS